MGEGDQLQWHFDQTDFVVSLAIQSAERGGDFEVVPRIRSAGDERYDDVAAVLAGRPRPGWRHCPMRPGTLLVFEGRHSLHRVSPIGGRRGATWACWRTTRSRAPWAATSSGPTATGAPRPFATPPETWPVPA